MLLILLVAVIDLTMSSATAATKTTGKLYFKNNHVVQKQVGPNPQDKILLWYCNKNHDHHKDWGSPGYQTAISMNSPYEDISKYRLVSSKITFIKKTGAKKPFTKSFKSDKWDIIGYNAPKGYKPYYAHVTYKY